MVEGLRKAIEKEDLPCLFNELHATGTGTEVRLLLHDPAAWRAFGECGKLKPSGKQCREPRRTAGTMISAAQCRCARTLLRWSVSKLASVASVSESAIDNFELERRQATVMTIHAIQRAFEDVGVVFLPQDDVQLRSNASAAR
jgi:hypothetical protein